MNPKCRNYFNTKNFNIYECDLYMLDLLDDFDEVKRNGEK